MSIQVSEAEQKIRIFFREELMKDWADTISLGEEFKMDSIDQVDTRIFLEEQFSIEFKNDQKPFESIQNILDIIPG